MSSNPRPEHLPELLLANRQRTVSYDVKFIRRIGELAMPHCVAACKSEEAALAQLRSVEVSIVSDKTIARVHGEFFDDPTPTDVITFLHGELVLGAETIRSNAKTYRQSPNDEAALCVVHGLLHLAGWNDLRKREAEAMAKRQEKIFQLAKAALKSA